MINFFVILSDGDNRSARRVRVAKTLQSSLEEEFVKQAESFRTHIENIPGKDGKREKATAASEPVDFFPLFTLPDNKHVFEIPDFELDPYILAAAKNPDSLQNLKLNDETIPQIRAFCVTCGTEKRPVVYFQSFDRRRVLQQSKMTFLQRDGAFAKLDEVGFTLSDSLQAIYDGGTLRFRSYAVVARFLNLLDLFNEASDEKIEAVLGNELFDVENQDDVVQFSDTHMRKQYSAIVQLGVLDRAKPKDVVNAANEFLDTPLGVVRKGGKERISFPKEKRDQKQLLSFLSEGLYKGPLTGEKYQSNSHRPLKKATTPKPPESSPKKGPKKKKK